MKKGIITLLLLALVVSVYSQGMSYEVRGNYQKTIAKEKLVGAKVMKDINPGYPSSWISGYESVEIKTTCDGITLKAVGNNDQLTYEQQNLLNKAKIGTHISVHVKYHPKNSNKPATIEEMSFTYTIIPEKEAEYPGGYDQLKQYLKENAIDKIQEPIASELQQVSLTFSIDEEGKAIDALMTKSSGHVKIDKLLLQTIIKMDKWLPAENSNGENVKQEFELIVGNMIGC